MSISALELTLRMKRIQIWLDDANAFADEATVRSDDEGRMQSFADNEWVWDEQGRLFKVAYDLLREIWLEGL